MDFAAFSEGGFPQSFVHGLGQINDRQMGFNKTLAR
jgi:hypothetical protein